MFIFLQVNYDGMRICSMQIFCNFLNLFSSFSNEWIIMKYDIEDHLMLYIVLNEFYSLHFNDLQVETTKQAYKYSHAFRK